MTEVIGTMVKAAATAVLPTAAASLPKIATEAFTTGAKALAEPISKAVKPGVEALTKLPGRNLLNVARPELAEGAFESARIPIGELGKGITPSITASVLEVIPIEARLSILERGFFSKAIMRGEVAHAPVLTSIEMKALGRIAGIDLPDDVLANPKFAESFSDALQNRLLTAEKENFSLEKSVLRSLQDALRSQKDAEDLEKLKRTAAKNAVKKRIVEWRKSIVSDRRFKDHPDEEKEALDKVNRYEQRLLLEVDIRFTFGSNLITETIGEVLRDSKAA